MKKIGVFLCILAISAAAVSPLFAQRGKSDVIEIKLASLVPDNTDWSRALDRMAQEWYKATNGEVVVTVYHSGVQGANESDVWRKLRGNQIQAAVFTSVGLSLIAPEVLTLSAPFLIRSNDELAYVLDNVQDDLENAINKKVVMLAWAHSGWIKMFTKAPVFTPADLRPQILGTGPELPAMNAAFKSMGFQLSIVDYKNVVIDLNSGKIAGIYQSPVYAASYQYFGIAKNMLNFNIAPIMGGIVINQQTWRKIPDKYKPQLLSIIKGIEQDISGVINNLEQGAIDVMGKNGLIINTPTEAQKQMWYNEVGTKIPPLANNRIFNRTIFNNISALLAAYRSR